MTAERIKIDRKSLRDPDEFQQLTTQAGAWIRANQRLVTGVVLGLVAVAAIGIGIGWYRARHDEAAAVQFQAAHAQFAAGKFADAAQAFAAVGTDYPSTPFGKLAALYRGHALERQGDAKAAVTAYQEYLNGTPRTDYLRQEALLGLARSEEAAGDRAAAATRYAEAAEMPGPFRTEAKLAQARLAEASGKPEQARDIYVALLAEAQPGTPLRAFLQSKMPAAVASGDTPAAAK
jgi:TolA-binding protein